LIEGDDHLGTMAALKINKILRLGAMVADVYL
jgi:hypothetical protein